MRGEEVRRIRGQTQFRGYTRKIQCRAGQHRRELVAQIPRHFVFSPDNEPAQDALPDEREDIGPRCKTDVAQRINQPVVILLHVAAFVQDELAAFRAHTPLLLDQVEVVVHRPALGEHGAPRALQSVMVVFVDLRRHVLQRWPRRPRLSPKLTDLAEDTGHILNRLCMHDCLQHGESARCCCFALRAKLPSMRKMRVAGEVLAKETDGEYGPPAIVHLVLCIDGQMHAVKRVPSYRTFGHASTREGNAPLRPTERRATARTDPMTRR